MAWARMPAPSLHLHCFSDRLIQDEQLGCDIRLDVAGVKNAATFGESGFLPRHQVVLHGLLEGDAFLRTASPWPPATMLCSALVIVCSSTHSTSLPLWIVRAFVGPRPAPGILMEELDDGL